MSTPTFNAIGLVVADLSRAMAFYGLLGLEFEAQGGHATCQVGPGMRLMLDTQELVTSLSPDWTPPSGGHRVAFAFECDSPDGVDAAFRVATEAGARVVREPWDAFWGQRYATVLDPDGNAVDLYAKLPAAP